MLGGVRGKLALPCEPCAKLLLRTQIQHVIGVGHGIIYSRKAEGFQFFVSRVAKDAKILSYADSTAREYAGKYRRSFSAIDEEPKVTAPEVTAPETTAPETTAPEATKPQVPEPEDTEPDSAVPVPTPPSFGNLIKESLILKLVILAA